MTIFGAGSGDYLQGGLIGNNSIVAGAGNETLAAEAGQTTLVGSTLAGATDDSFSFLGHGAGQTYTVDQFTSNDLLYLASTATSAGQVASQGLQGSNYVITLGDNTKIILVNYTGSTPAIGHAT